MQIQQLIILCTIMTSDWLYFGARCRQMHCLSIFQGGGAQKLGIAYMIRLAFKYFSDKKS